MSSRRTISNTFTVTTMDDPVSVQAQYSPDMITIHTTWQDGDIYMRTKQSNETTWSSWHKIVGESGDETDYTFNISMSLTSSSATTVPANCYYLFWQDAPVAPTSDFPYLWMKIVKKTWNESTQSYDSGTARYSRVTGEKGDNGADAPYIELSRSTILYQANNDGYSIASQNFDITYSLKVKGNTCTISSTSSISISLPSDVTVVSGTKTTYGCTINCTHNKIMSGVITITITGTYNGVTYTATGTITVDSSRQGEQGGPGEPGKPGERGKVGRFYYYAGVFDVSDTTTQFLVNDAQSPFFAYNNKYWVYNPEDNPSGGTTTMSAMGTPSSSSSNWKLMTSDFKYIITEAIFGSYAHFGSWVFNGDYMLSEKDDDGNPRGQREYNGMGDSQLTSGFIPSIAFDALNGRASFCGDKARFQPNGAGWLANKNIQWDANGNLTIVGDIEANNGTFNGVIKTPYRKSSNWFTTLKEGGCIRIEDADVGLSLPYLDSFDGVELDIMNNTDRTTYVATMLKDKNGNGIGIALRHYKLATVRLQAGSRCKLKAIPYIEGGRKYVIWLILNEGNFDIYSLKDYNNNTYYVARDKSITPIPG